MASVERIVKVAPHERADKLEVAQVLGYQVVVQKGAYKEGDLVVYVQPDSVLPDDEWAAPYKKYAPRRIRAVSLRGVYSEGLVVDVPSGNYVEGDDVSDVLHVKRYEEQDVHNPYAPRRPIPYGIPRTSELRWERVVGTFKAGTKVDVTLKIDGHSASYYYRREGDEFGATSRNCVITNISQLASYRAHVSKYDLEYRLKRYCTQHNVSLCLRGESYGVGIQKTGHNPHCKKEPDIAFFSVWLIDEKRYAHKGDQHYVRDVCRDVGLPAVPLIEEDVELTIPLLQRYATLERLNGVPFEGVVVQGPTFSFKVINRYYDSKK